MPQIPSSSTLPMLPSLTGLSYIAGEWVKPTGQPTFNAYNPATNELLPTQYYETDQTLVDLAAEKAQSAFSEYRLLSAKQRSNFLSAIARQLQQLGPGIIEQAINETALPETRLTSELQRTINQLKLFADLLTQGLDLYPIIDQASPNRQPLPKPDIRQTQIPIGPVAVFGASNFPLAFSVAGGDTASALAAGCPVIVKGHPLHPGTSEFVTYAIDLAIKETAMPAGIFSLLQGQQHSLSELLVKQPAIKAVGFTGSLLAGRHLYNLACERPEPIPFFGELAASNPVFILPDALKQQHENIADNLCKSFTLNAGQFCTKPGLVVVMEDENLSTFIETLKKLCAQQPAQTMLSASIYQHYIQQCDKRQSIPGVITLASGRPSQGNNQAQVQLLSTSAKHFLKHPNLENEIFGPTTLLIICANEDELFAITDQLSGQLTASIFQQQNTPLVEQLMLRIQQRVGRIIFNAFPTGVEVNHAMHHGGPYPATTNSHFTSVGSQAIQRFLQPCCYQNTPDELLPPALQNANPLKLWRLVDGKLTQAGW
ncbi:aldehyde dehydrogenase (NADP(+)) [Zooshikella marina]|uniref:aldehyde dehydrogenase (NADP(+)) n=1 Tax=Zooshikella ganghwensis TaxID=202772 RepID=UPI001BAEB00C|nr:aldehyde dehydrogenase (NADP(+)) [Zooshikella ganghwensis]MBU2705292.1 aldehyde dehydrogenase (NADP(+)) [Zooshikella ganghwensis]